MSYHVRALCVSIGAVALLSTALNTPVSSAAPSAPQPYEPAAQQLTPPTFGLIKEQPKGSSATADTTELYDYINPCSLVPLPEIREITSEPVLYYSVKNDESLTANVNDAQVWSSRHHRRLTCNLTSGINNGGLHVNISCQLRMSSVEFWKRYHTENNDSVPSRIARKAKLAIPGVDDVYVGYMRHGKHEHPWRLTVRTKYGTELAVTGPENIDTLADLMRKAVSTIDGSRYGYTK